MYIYLQERRHVHTDVDQQTVIVTATIEQKKTYYTNRRQR